MHFYLTPLNACAAVSQEHSANSTDLSPLVKELSDLFLAGQLTVNVLEKKFAATAVQAENKEYWSINSEKYSVRSTAKANDKSSPVSVLQFNTNELSQLALKDLEKIFGDSKLLVHSKSFWVTFADKKNPKGKSVLISAQLYSLPEAEVAPVLRLKLMLE